MGFAWVPPSYPFRCCGVTASGKACQRYAGPGGYCRQHQAQSVSYRYGGAA